MHSYIKNCKQLLEIKKKEKKLKENQFELIVRNYKSLTSKLLRLFFQDPEEQWGSISKVWG